MKMRRIVLALCVTLILAVFAIPVVSAASLPAEPGDGEAVQEAVSTVTSDDNADASDEGQAAAPAADSEPSAAEQAVPEKGANTLAAPATELPTSNASARQDETTEAEKIASEKDGLDTRSFTVWIIAVCSVVFVAVVIGVVILGRRNRNN